MAEVLHGAVLIQLDQDVVFTEPHTPKDATMGVGVITAPEAEASTIMPTLPVLTNGYKLEGESWVIGRDRDCDVRVKSGRVDISRKHATIRRQRTNYTLYDHSRHGTFVNNIRIFEPCRLDTADVIGLANTREMFRFVNYDQIAPFVQLLSEREHEVLSNLATGLSVKQIADKLKISQNTVQTHLRHLYEKLEINSRDEAVAKARKLQLLHKP